jgi:serine/threonine-protein kinase RsbW
MRRKGRSGNLVRADEPPLPPGQCVADIAFGASNETKNEVLDAVLKALRDGGILPSPEEETRARLCLDEALVNAVMHGCRYDAAKTIRVRAFVDDESWSVLVEDPGAGFREEDLPDPAAAENLLEESGRGVHLMCSMLDHVSYWRGGSALLLKHRRNR